MSLHPYTPRPVMPLSHRLYLIGLILGLLGLSSWLQGDLVAAVIPGVLSIWLFRIAYHERED